MNHKKKIQIGSIVTFCLVSGTAFAVLYGGGPAEKWTATQIAALSKAVSGSLAAFASTYSANSQIKHEQVVSAIAVATKQEALSGASISDSIRESAAQLSNAVKAQRQNKEIADSILAFNPNTSQGFQPCSTLNRNKTLDFSFNQTAETIKVTMSSIDVAPGKMVDSVSEAMEKRIESHRQYFCTEAEEDAGLCDLSDLPGGDTNANLLFEPTELNSLQHRAQISYIQNVLGMPDPVIDDDAGKTVAGQMYMFKKNQKDALMSIPAYSLAQIQASNLKREEFGDKSPNEILRLRVNQYFGGKEAQEWSGVLAAQTERGLMVEQLKQDGLATWMRYQRYKQNQRIELNMAALVMAASEQEKNKVDSYYLAMMKNSSSNQIQ